MSTDLEPGAEPKKPAKPNPYRELFANPASRVYLMVAGGGLLVTLLTMFLIGSPIAVVLLLIVGVCGLILRWTAMPVFYVLMVSWLTYAPLGLPFDDNPFSSIPGSHFRFLDFILIGSSLVYLIGQYRLLSIVHVGMPFDAGPLFVKKGAKPTVRPAEAPRDWELWMLFGRAGIFVLGGQFLWLAITFLRLDFGKTLPLTYVVPTETVNRRFDSRGRAYLEEDPLFIADYLSRFLLALSFFLVVALAARFVFWYWGLLQLQRDQAQMILVDTQWSEHRREMSRQEKWRGYRKGKILGAVREKFGCGGWFLALGLPALLLLLFLAVLCCSGGIK